MQKMQLSINILHRYSLFTIAAHSNYKVILFFIFAEHFDVSQGFHSGCTDARHSEWRNPFKAPAFLGQQYGMFSRSVCVTLGRQVPPLLQLEWGRGWAAGALLPRVAGPERPEPAWLLGEARSRCWTHRPLVACARPSCQPLPGASLALSWLS